MKDPAVVEGGWEDLCKALDLPEKTLDNFLTDYSFGDVTIHKILSTSLICWITSAKTARTVKELHAILSNLKNLFHSRGDTIGNKFWNKY